MNMFKEFIRSFAIMNVCWKNADTENISFNIDKNMSFSTVNFFSIRRTLVRRLLR